MRIAFVCKRHYMRKDVIRDKYARLYEFPRHLALKGHDVLAVCPSYRRVEERDERHEALPGHLRWVGLSPGTALPIGVSGYPKRTMALLEEFAPDVVVGASDALHIVFAAWLARRLTVPYAVDLYDNFESFGLTRIPGVRSMFRKAVAGAPLVACVSDPLARFVTTDYRASGKVIVMPSTIDREVFCIQDKRKCRLEFGLPFDRKLVGTAGGLQAEKGIGCLYSAFEQFAAKRLDVDLVLAGGIDVSCPPPADVRVHYLGELDHSTIPRFFGALDVGVVYVQDTAYGRYSFPQKAYEMIGCGIPIVAGKVGAMDKLFESYPQSQYKPDDPDSLADQILSQLSNPVIPAIEIPDWSELASSLETELVALLESRSRRC